MTDTLELSGTDKSFGTLKAVDDLSLTVAAGERVALLGHNGAGKSTLMKIILGLMPADRGTISVFGARPGSAEARRFVAYLPENVAFHPALTGREQLRLFCRLRRAAPDAAGQLLARVRLDEAADRRIGTYSKGMRQRLGLAQALIGRPRLFVLDEPTSGLDPVSRREFYAILEELAGDGAAILLSSHALTEVEAKTDRIAIMRRGRLVANAPLAALRSRSALPVRLHVVARAGDADRVAASLAGSRINGVGVDILCAPEDKLDRIGAIAALGPLIEDIEVAPPSLEDIYAFFSREERP
ncbi:ABC transporter ATP-binding protein [Oceanibacterium hippocampi]|uniref:Putative ABC transporter ATP-binding protein YxlF n=1 Tax=Oceanibacterium hippocampi TaxID=745714 RepID=A0A1Y5TG06_9PROT|nr:ABC transporter ATP-binding protein [Oceanibacterium hippocampi]SLN61024.1 putative ABC transporter ATP-binding protein YxlF [Oceanibacterium hippocampi]